jgi:hypothetical protein
MRLANVDHDFEAGLQVALHPSAPGFDRFV